MRQLPNILTLLRIVLAIFFVLFLAQNSFAAVVIAAVIFFFASLTDYYDGYFAKKHNTLSAFGVIMDPIADKFLILAAFFIFVQMQLVLPWMFWVIFVREVLVTGSRLFSIRQGKVIAAEKAGKCKTVFQMFTISVILFFIILQKSTLSSLWINNNIYIWQVIISALMLMTVILTVYSGIIYFWNNQRGSHV